MPRLLCSAIDAAPSIAGEIDDLRAGGATMEEIAAELDVSQRTIEGHRSRIRDKMHARGIADLIRMLG